MNADRTSMLIYLSDSGERDSWEELLKKLSVFISQIEINFTSDFSNIREEVIKNKVEFLLLSIGGEEIEALESLLRDKEIQSINKLIFVPKELKIRLLEKFHFNENILIRERELSSGEKFFAFLRFIDKLIPQISSRDDLQHLSGKKLNNILIGDLIGKGGIGIIYLGYQPTLERKLAIKFIQRQLGDSFQSLERAQREALIISQLNHPNIIRVFDANFINNNIFYIVMDFIDGLDLGEYIKKKGKLSWQEALYIIAQVASGLGEAHRNNIIHRDIKPSNILLNKNRQVFLTDFGIAKERDSNLSLTVQGIVLGTPYYLSPEQALGKKLDHRSDIYSLGLVFFEAITGQVPFSGYTPFETVAARLKNPLPDIKKFVPEVPDNLVKIIEKMAARDAENRYQNCEELLNDIYSNFGELLSSSNPAFLQISTPLLRSISLQSKDSEGSGESDSKNPPEAKPHLSISEPKDEKNTSLQREDELLTTLEGEVVHSHQSEIKVSPPSTSPQPPVAGEQEKTPPSETSPASSPPAQSSPSANQSVGLNSSERNVSSPEKKMPPERESDSLEYLLSQALSKELDRELLLDKITSPPTPSETKVFKDSTPNQIGFRFQNYPEKNYPLESQKITPRETSPSPAPVQPPRDKELERTREIDFAMKLNLALISSNSDNLTDEEEFHLKKALYHSPLLYEELKEARELIESSKIDRGLQKLWKARQKEPENKDLIKLIELISQRLK